MKSKWLSFCSWMGLFIILVSVGCDGGGNRIEENKTIDRVGKEITMTVFVYDTRNEFVDAYESFYGNRDAPEWGFSRYTILRDADTGEVFEPDELTCEIHTMNPRFVDDERVLTAGHELFHCVWGEYHGMV